VKRSDVTGAPLSSGLLTPEIKLCGANGGEDNRVFVTGKKARREEASRKTKMYVVDNIKMDLV
jgi:hypothetical protein